MNEEIAVEANRFFFFDVKAAHVDIELLYRIDKVLFDFIFSDLRPDLHLKRKLRLGVLQLNRFLHSMNYTVLARMIAS